MSDPVFRISCIFLFYIYFQGIGFIIQVVLCILLLFCRQDLPCRMADTATQKQSLEYNRYHIFISHNLQFTSYSQLLSQNLCHHCISGSLSDCRMSENFQDVIVHDHDHQRHQKHQSCKMNHSLHFPVDWFSSNCFDDQKDQSSSVQCRKRQKVHNPKVC